MSDINLIKYIQTFKYYVKEDTTMLTYDILINNYCLYGMFMYLIMAINMKLLSEKQISIGVKYFLNIVYMYSKIPFRIVNKDILLTIITNNLPLFYDQIKNYNLLGTSKYLTNLKMFHLNFSKEDIDNIIKMLYHVGKHGVPYHIGASMEQIFFIHEIVNNVVVENLPLSGNIFMKYGDNYIVDEVEKQKVEKYCLDIVTNSFGSSMYELERGNNIEFWDYLHNGRSVVSISYLFYLLGYIDRLIFKVMITEDGREEELERLIDLIPELKTKINIEYHYVNFSTANVSSYMINADKVPTFDSDFFREVFGFNSNYYETHSFLNPSSCSRCTPRKAPTKWTLDLKHDIYKQRGVYQSNISTKLLNYKGCNFSRLYIVMFLIIYGYILLPDY